MGPSLKFVVFFPFFLKSSWVEWGFLQKGRGTSERELLYPKDKNILRPKQSYLKYRTALSTDGLQQLHPNSTYLTG